MKHSVILFTCVVIAVTIAAAQRYAAGDPPVAEQPPPAPNSDQPSAETPSPENSSPEQLSPETSGAEQTSPLEELKWLVGQWVDAEKDSTVSSSCSWTQNHKFLTQKFSMTSDGGVSLEGVQKIGWDPIEKRIRSWIFDSEGGFGEASWIKDGNRWEAKTTFTLASGERASAVNVYTYVDPNTYRWESVDREVGGEMQPSIAEVTVVRKKTDAAGEGQGKADEGSKDNSGHSQKEASP